MEYYTEFIDERPILEFIDERPIMEFNAPGPMGPPGLQNVTVSQSAPANPRLDDLWVRIV